MNLNEFEKWLQDNPSATRRLEDVSWYQHESPPMPKLLHIYEEFLNRFGPLELSGYVLMGRKNIPYVTAFIQDLSYPEEDVIFEHLVPFCSLGYDDCYLCFDGSSIVLFNPLEPESIDQVIATSFEAFLDQVTQGHRF